MIRYEDVLDVARYLTPDECAFKGVTSFVLFKPYSAIIADYSSPSKASIVKIEFEYYQHISNLENPTPVIIDMTVGAFETILLELNRQF